MMHALSFALVHEPEGHSPLFDGLQCIAVISVQRPLFQRPCIFCHGHVIGRCDLVCRLGLGLYILPCVGVGYVCWEALDGNLSSAECLL
jgi:hypothetical protein